MCVYPYYIIHADKNPHGIGEKESIVEKKKKKKSCQTENLSDYYKLSQAELLWTNFIPICSFFFSFLFLGCFLRKI